MYAKSKWQLCKKLSVRGIISFKAMPTQWPGKKWRIFHMWILKTDLHIPIHIIYIYIYTYIPKCPVYTILEWAQIMTCHLFDKQRFLMPGHQGWNDLHSLCRIGMEYYLLNNDDNNIIYWIMMIIMIMMMIIIMIIMMTMMIIGTATIMIMIIIITRTLTMTIMKMIMIKTAQTPCQSLYKDRRI